MNINEKLDSSLRHPSTISLFLEGTFWKAYEQSAFLFVKGIKSYKLSVKYMKVVSAHVVSLGFPNNAIGSVLAGFNYRFVNEKQVEVEMNTSYTSAIFEEWKEETVAAQKVVPPPVTQAVVQPVVQEVVPPSPAKQSAAEGLLHQLLANQLLALPIDKKTPLECMQFLSAWQVLLKQSN